ncbi:MAG: helix-turn-helix transcriptional regulator [Kiritimatiellae bacterium]|nr:helix-turn-helix transcriptional regulator [Kiritimatiellia bacterium]
MPFRTVSPGVFLRALLREREPFEVVTAGHAVVPQAWRGRTWQRRGPEDSLVYGLEYGRLLVETPAGTPELAEQCLMWAHGGLAVRFVIPDDVDNVSVWFIRFRLGAPQPLRLVRRLLLTDRMPDGLACLETIRQLHGRTGELAGLGLRMELGRLLRLIVGEPAALPATGRQLTPRQRGACLAFIHGHLRRFFRIRELAGACGLNPAYLSMQFTRTFGQSIQAYVKTARVREAQNLLLGTNLRIGEIAGELGYRDMYYFSRQFKDVTGLSPRAWRARNEGAP